MPPLSLVTNSVRSAPFASNLAVSASNTAAFASNLSINNQDILTLTSNTTFTTSSLSISLSNLAYTNSNLLYPTSDTAIWASNVAQASSNVAYPTSNVAYETSIVAYATSNIAYETCNLAHLNSNVAYATSNIAYETCNVAHQASTKAAFASNFAVNSASSFASSNITGSNATFNGRIGLGLAGAPAYTMDVNGDINVTGNFYKAGTVFVGGGGSAGWSNNGVDVFYTTASNLTDGAVGIGKTNPLYKLDVNGDIYASGDVISLSDSRFKTNVETIVDGLDKVLKLRGCTFTRQHDENGHRHMGVIAQELDQVVPECVSHDSEGNLSVAYGNLSALLIEAIKGLNQRIDSLLSNDRL
jgi:Chaperone of endosialidase